jgi:hypothetical protein
MLSFKNTNTAGSENRRKTGGHRAGLLLILFCCGISVLWGVQLAQSPHGFVDIKAAYNATRCLIEGHNPYNARDLAAVYEAERGPGPRQPAMFMTTMTLYMNLPGTFVLIAPLALLPFAVANTIWLSLAAVLLILAAWLMWRQGARSAPTASLVLICFLLANNQIAFEVGNTAVLVIGLCVLATWCIAEDRFGLVGVLCLGLSLAVKPHDAGFIWLYFLLAGGIYRRRALLSLLVAAYPAVMGFLWVGHVAPHWMQYWQANMRAISGPGGLNEPGPYAITGFGGGMVIDLQSAICVLWTNPKIYNLVSYLICGALLLVWVLRTVKLRYTRANVWLGLAAVLAPTLLITYHRGYDAKLLLLAIPACAMLWSKRGVTGWFALSLTSLAVLFTADIPLQAWVMLRPYLPVRMSGVLGNALAMVLLVPTPFILLAMGIFYLWAYVKSDAVLRVAAKVEEPKRALLVPEPA